MAVNGLNNVLGALKKFEDAISQEVREQVEFHTGEIELSAIRNAPGPGEEIITEDGSQTQADIARSRAWTPINQAIGYTISDNGFRGTVFVERSAGEIAVWVEMGTGQSAKSYLSTVEPEWRSVAQKYYINGKGTIINQPYLYPAYLRGRIDFLNDLKQALKNISK